MAVDHRLDLLRMHLQPADIDDAVAPADEVVALAAQLDHVAGVDEAVGVAERRPRAEIAASGARRAERSEPSSTRISTSPGRPTIGWPESPPARRSPRRRRRPRSRRRRGRSAAGEARLQRVENGLVGDLARQADVARRRSRAASGSSARGASARACRRGASRRARPRRARKSATGSPGAVSTSEPPPSRRAQQDLQAAVAADVVERAPHRRPAPARPA